MPLEISATFGTWQIGLVVKLDPQDSLVIASLEIALVQLLIELHAIVNLRAPYSDVAISLVLPTLLYPLG